MFGHGNDFAELDVSLHPLQKKKSTEHFCFVDFSVSKNAECTIERIPSPGGGLRINRGDLPTEPHLTPSAKVAFERRQR